jgi:hypothetical protein
VSRDWGESWRLGRPLRGNIYIGTPERKEGTKTEGADKIEW